MRLERGIIAGLTVFFLSGAAAPPAGLSAIADAMGATNLNSIEYSASGSNFGFGQAYLPGEKWPRFEQRIYVVDANYQAASMKLDAVRSQGEHPPHGGAAQPVAADQRTVQVVSGKFAWSEAGGRATPNPDAATDRALQLWATPHGIVKAALANNGTLNGNTIAVTVGGRELKANVNAQNLIDKVSFQRSSEVVGDYPVEIAYSDYADFNGVKFPRHIVMTEDGFPTLDVAVRDVKPNAPVTLTAPMNVQQAPPSPEVPAVTMDKLGDGIWYVNCDGVRSWAVEFDDYIVAVEGIGRDARSLAVNDAIRKQIPGKPIRYVVNTHAHYDHAGGLRTYVAQGIAIVTQETNRPFFERVWQRPHTIAPDSLSKNPKAPTFETVADKKVITDGKQTLEIYRLKGSGHNGANMIVYEPKNGIVFWGDGYNPPEGDNPVDAGRTPEYGIDLYRNFTELNLNIKTIAPAHGAGARPYDNLKKAIGMMVP